MPTPWCRSAAAAVRPAVRLGGRRGPRGGSGRRSGREHARRCGRGTARAERRHWTRVAASTDLPDGGVRGFDVDGVTGFVRRDGGQVAAVSGICTHQGCALRLDAPARELRCPCHRTSFAVNGTLVSHQLPTPPRALPTCRRSARPTAGSRCSRRRNPRCEHLDPAVGLADRQRGQRPRRRGQLVADQRAVHRERRAVARAPQLPGGRVQPQRAALVRADARDGGHLPAVAPHEPGDAVDVEATHAAVGQVGAGRHPGPRAVVRHERALGHLGGRARGPSGDRSHREARGGHRAELQHATAAAADRHTASASSSSSSVARRRRRSATNSSLAAPLPARPARSSIAARIWAASSSSGRKPRVRLPRNRSSTNRRTLMPAPHPAARRGAAPGAAAPWRWPR